MTHTINKNLDILENYARENFFDIEDLRSQIESKNKFRSKSADKKDNRGQTDAKAELENEFQEYRKVRFEIEENYLQVFIAKEYANVGEIIS